MSLIMSGIKLTDESEKRLGYFLKIEELQLAIFLVLCTKFKPDAVLDVGANVGFYSLSTHKYFPYIAIHAFEPTPDTYFSLSKNVSQNAFSNAIKTYNLALSAQKCVGEFLDFGDCSGKNSLSDTSIHRAVDLKQKLVVEIDTLDNIYPHAQQRMIVKIDTEGNELNVIQGGMGFLKKNICVLQLETGHKNGCSEADQLIRSLGYSLMFTMGPDSYYTNGQSMAADNTRLGILESAMNFVINHRWNIDSTPQG